jgi:EAL domain-containing protein (putative c-di-GMP-specific phosphodiesterase class I)
MSFDPEAADGMVAVRERLALGIATFRRPRGLALLSIRVRPRPGSAPPSAELNREIHRELERRIRLCLHPSDSAASSGAMRYVVLLERGEIGPFAMDVADRIVAAVGRFELPGPNPVRLAASIGISVHPDDGEDVDELLRCADSASEAAEAAGGNLFGFYSQPMNERAERGARIERALIGALEREEFRLCFQPQIDTRDGSLKGVEALLRFQSSSLGMVPPDQFIPVLESTGGIGAVGAWVLEHACKQAADWMNSGRPVRVGVNVSARQLAHDDFADTVMRALDLSGLPASLLELELTESVLVENPIETRKRIEGLRARGLRVALDDFGTGYASLAYIRHFPMDELKIDRQFVRGLPVDAEAVAITSAIVALARSLRLDIVAEGVENEAEEEFLHSQHCFVVQGYLHARPMFCEDFELWRRKRPWA